MPVAKLLLIGLPGSGKTETIRAISHFPAQVVKKRVPATQSTLSLDYGRVFFDPSMVYLYSSADSGRMLDSDWQGLMGEMNCVILVMKGSASATQNLQFYFELTKHQWPKIIAINGVTMPDYNETLYQELQALLPASTRIVIYDAIDQAGSRRVIAAALETIRGA